MKAKFVCKIALASVGYRRIVAAADRQLVVGQLKCYSATARRLVELSPEEPLLIIHERDPDKFLARRPDIWHASIK